MSTQSPQPTPTRQPRWLTGAMVDELPTAQPGDLVRCFGDLDLHRGNVAAACQEAIDREKAIVQRHRPDLVERLNYVAVLCQIQAGRPVWSDEPEEWTGPVVPTTQFQFFALDDETASSNSRRG